MGIRKIEVNDQLETWVEIGLQQEVDAKLSELGLSRSDTIKASYKIPFGEGELQFLFHGLYGPYNDTRRSWLRLSVNRFFSNEDPMLETINQQDFLLDRYGSFVIAHQGLARKFRRDDGDADWDIRPSTLPILEVGDEPEEVFVYSGTQYETALIYEPACSSTIAGVRLVKALRPLAKEYAEALPTIHYEDR